MIFQFKPAARLKASLDPQAIGEELDRLRGSGEGFTPSAVVEAARPETSPLHPHFSWDLTADEALARVLEQEASYLIRNVVVVVEDHGVRETGPAFVSVIAKVAESPLYVPVIEALTDEEYRSQVLGDAINAFIALRQRHRHLNELATIFAAIDAVVAAR